MIIPNLRLITLEAKGDQADPATRPLSIVSSL